MMAIQSGLARGGRPSISDVARRAGVSLGTVSNTLNRPDKVAPATRERVERAIAELGFVRNAAASALAAGASNRVGLVVIDLRNSFFIDVIRGAQAGLAELGIDMLIADADNSSERQARHLDLLDQLDVDGIMLAPIDTAEMRQARHLVQRTPLVLLNTRSDVGAYPSVKADERAGGAAAARHLIAQGRRRLAFLGGPLEYLAIADRLEGAQGVAAASGASFEYVNTHGLDFAEGRAAAAAFLARGPGVVDGLICASDRLAAGLIGEFEGHAGFSVPGDVSITGYDNNLFLSDALSTSITTVNQHGEEIGREGAALIADRILHPEGAVRAVLVPEPTVIARGSSGGPAAS